MSNIPIQTIPFSQKNQEWARQTAEAIISLSSFNTSGQKYMLKLFYDAYAGNTDFGEYSHLTKPWGDNFKNFPAKLTNYNIIKPVIDRLIGERIQRPFIFQVSAVNSDIQTLKEEQITQLVQGTLKQMFINELNQLGLTDIPQDETQDPQQIKQFIETNYKDQRAILGQQALDYIVDYNEFAEKGRKGFLDYMVSGEVYSYRGIEHDEPTFNIINPLEIDYQRDPDKDYIEDADWVIHYTLVNPSTIVSKFYDDPEFTKEMIDELENPNSPAGTYPFSIYTMANNNHNPYSIQRLVPIVHITWQSKQKLGIVKYVDEFGIPNEKIVSEEYTPLPNEEVKWMWVNQPWETYKVYDKWYFRTRPIPEASLLKNNISLRKLPYNGRMYSNRNTTNVSLVSLGMPYQITYNIYKYRYELMIAKAKGIIGVIDLNAKPNDWSMDKWLHYIESMGLMITNYADKEVVRHNPTGTNEINLSLGNFINTFETLLASIRSEWEALCGVTRQRQGDIKASELVGNVEAAIYQSSAITESLFYDYSNFERRDLQYLVDLSKIAWVNGKKANFITHDGRNIYFSIDGAEYANAEYGVFLKNTSKEYRKLETAKQMAQAFIQNGLGPSSALEILDGENFSEIKQKVREAERHERLLNDQLERMKIEQQTQLEQMIAAKEAEQREFDAEQNQLDRDNKIEVATITSLGIGKVGDSDGDNVPDILEVRELALKERSQNLAERKQLTDEQFKKEELQIKKKQANKPKSK
jgi:hypothetical protein